MGLAFSPLPIAGGDDVVHSRLGRGRLPVRRFLVHLGKVAALQEGFAVRLFADLIENATRFRVVTGCFGLSTAKPERLRQ